jgi:hypothetical protein
MKIHHVALALVVLAAFVQPGSASSIIIGSSGSNNVFPFGDTYLGEYQQVYTAADFGGSVLIDQVAFRSINGFGGRTLSDTLTLGLGTTSASPSAPGTSYAGNKRPDLTTVFTGTVSETLAGNGTFDFFINFSSPFLYNPTLGNLLLDVFVTNTSGGIAPFDAGNSPDTGRLFNLGGNGTATPGPNFGLVTRFDVTAVPEPATISLVGIGVLAMLVAEYRRRRKDMRHSASAHKTELAVLKN